MKNLLKFKFAREKNWIWTTFHNLDVQKLIEQGVLYKIESVLVPIEEFTQEKLVSIYKHVSNPEIFLELDQNTKTLYGEPSKEAKNLIIEAKEEVGLNIADLIRHGILVKVSDNIIQIQASGPCPACTSARVHSS